MGLDGQIEQEPLGQAFRVHEGGPAELGVKELIGGRLEVEELEHWVHEDLGRQLGEAWEMEWEIGTGIWFIKFLQVNINWFNFRNGQNSTLMVSGKKEVWKC